MEHLNKLIGGFKGKNVLVIGDLILDQYIFGDVERINPEAPVPVLKVERTEYRLGGAANVANNIAALGGAVTVIGQVGIDDNRKELERELSSKNIDFKLLESKNFQTIKKTRIVARSQQAIRVDWESPSEITVEQAKKAVEMAKGFDVIVISDYNKGVVTEDLIEGLKELPAKIIADPKPHNIGLFKGVYAITPNLKEGREITGTALPEKVCNKLAAMLGCNIILTRGAEGVSLLEDGEHQYLPAQAKEVYDVSGAGDTFVSVVALGVASGASLYESVMLANQAAGIVVGKVGTAILSADELAESFNVQDSKIKTAEQIVEICEKLSSGKKVVLTNGCFDILHAGHVKLLKEAKSAGDVLVLALNTDESVKRLKGKGRPVNDQEDRAEVLANLESVDYIVFFDEEDDLLQLIATVKPDFMIKGQDYKEEDITGADLLEEWGGELKLVDLHKDLSSSDFVK